MNSKHHIDVTMTPSLHEQLLEQLVMSPPLSSAEVPFDDDIELIEAELTWVELKMRKALLARALRGTTPKKKHHQASPPNLRALQAQRDLLSAQERLQRERIDQRLSLGRAQGKRLALDSLTQDLALNDFERLVLVCALIPGYCAELSELIGDLSGFAHVMSVSAVMELSEHPRRELLDLRECFALQGPLMREELINLDRDSRMSSAEDLLHASIFMSLEVFSRLVGKPQMMEQLHAFSALHNPMATFAQVVLAPHTQQRLLTLVDEFEPSRRVRQQWGLDETITYGRGMAMLFYGDPGTGKTLTAHAIAHRLGKRVLHVDIPAFLQHSASGKFLSRLFREARQHNALLFFDECEPIFASRSHGNVLMNVLLTELERFDGMAIMATNMPDQLDEALMRRLMLRLHFTQPDRLARQAIWRRLLPEQLPLAHDVDLSCLAERYALNGGYIKNAVLMATTLASARQQHSPTLSMRDLEEAAREQLTHPGQQERAQIPSARLSDVVLEPHAREQLELLLAQHLNSSIVYERWGMAMGREGGRGRNLLLAGPSGTGKTFCAEALAGELCVPLLHINAGMLLSKWVGEAEARLRSLFAQAQGCGAILLFDEADSVLMARGEGRASRHDDSLVNGVLTELDRFNGLVVFTTNRPEVLDQALLRRVHFTVSMTLPTAPLRAQIWRQLLHRGAPIATEIDFEQLGAAWELSGAQIQQAVLSAAYDAAQRAQRIDEASLHRAARAIAHS